jgi:hypothetical protein
MATSIRHSELLGMPGRHLLTFELSEEGDELTIHGDPAGLRLLAQRVSELATKAEIQSNPSAVALSTSVWGGNELSLEPQGIDTKLIYQVRIVARPPRPK